MNAPMILACYSESGGATKTTTAVSLAMIWARAGYKVLLIDLDPRAAATRWISVAPAEAGLDVSAILGNPDPDGWANDLAVQAPEGWAETLSVIPSARLTSLIEAGHADGQELRLRRALAGVQADVVIIDCPNRQGGVLTQNALYAAQGVVYAAKPDTDGREGVEGAMQSVRRHQRNLAALGVPNVVREAGIVLGATTTTVQPRIERHTIDTLSEQHSDLLLRPFVPSRTIVRESRETSSWYGNYDAGAPVVTAYEDIAAQIITRMENHT